MDVGLAELLASLSAIGHSLQEAFDPRRFLGEFSGPVGRLVPHDRLMISHLEEGGRLSVFAEYARRGPLVHAGHYSIDFDPAGHYSAEEQVLGSVLAGEAMLVHDIQADPRFAPVGGIVSTVRQVGLRSRLAVPLRSGGRTIGTFSATSYAPALYREEHLEAFRRVADLIAPFIENVVLLHRERRRRRRLAALTDLAAVFGASLNIQGRLDQLAEAVRPHLEFDVMTVALVGSSGRELEIVRRVGGLAEGAAPGRIPLEGLSLYRRIERGEAVLLSDAAKELDSALPGDRAILEGGSRSGLLLPLQTYEGGVGTLLFGTRKPNWYNSADVEIGRAIAAQVVVALQHQRLAEEREERARAEGRARRLEAHLLTLRQELGAPRYGFDRMLGRAPVFLEALSRAAKVAPAETTVLLTGESGTGKELVARAIHQASPRADGPYVALNCAALSESLVESELFGHERGAFTGAEKQKPGRFELAAGGTLFLDEVAELPPPVQAKLLRVLQEHEFERVGGTVTQKADVRLIAATNRDLPSAVADGRFREDLFYRLDVFSIHLPPLRERGDDILVLARHFLREIALRLGKGERALGQDALEVLRAYRWPGNIRELENAIERALILAEGRLVSAAHLGLGGGWAAEGGSHREPPGPSALEPLDELERRAVLAALRETGGNKTRAAARLGITRTKLHTRLKRFGVA
ncbi:MAG: sigma 54-interacting transcriptional regulator [Candidatus Methylomirabilota bacterium]